MGKGARALGEVGNDVVNQPGVLPGKAHGWFRKWFAHVWKVRGGGLYAVGYAVTFLYLEVMSVVGDIADADGVSSFFGTQLIEFLFRFLGDWVMNMALAFIWPVLVIDIQPPYGLIGLGLAFIVFPAVLKKPIERWLFGAEIDGPPVHK